MFEDRRPGGVTALAILVGIVGVVALVIGFISLIGAGATWLGQSDASAIPAVAIASFYIAVGLVTLFVAWSLMNLRPWAWMLAVGVVVLQLVGHVVSVVAGDIGVSQAIAASVIPVIVLVYLTRPRVRGVFRGGNAA